MTNTKLTTALNVATKNYYRDSVPQAVFTSNVVRRIFMENAEKIFHGGPDSYYPYMDATGFTNVYDPYYDGAIGSAATPAETDTLAAMHQEGWAFFRIRKDLSHKSMVVNVGDWAKNERVFSLAKQKMDELMFHLAYMIEYSIIRGDGTNGMPHALGSLMNASNTNLWGLNFTSTDAAMKPYTVTIASANALDLSNLYVAYQNLADATQEPQVILMPPAVQTRLNILADATVERSQGGTVDFGFKKFTTLGAKMVSSRVMPSNRMYFLNFSAEPDLDLIKGSRNVKEGKYCQLEFAGPSPMGFKFYDWAQWGPEYPEVVYTMVTGAWKFWMFPPKQGYIAFTS